MLREINNLFTITKTTTKNYVFHQVGLDFMEFTESYKTIRAKARYRGFECFKCKKPFDLGERISLGLSNQGNKVFCRKCAKEIKEYIEEA